MIQLLHIFDNLRRCRMAGNLLLAGGMLSLHAFYADAHITGMDRDDNPDIEAANDTVYRLLQEVDVVAVKQLHTLDEMPVSGNIIGPGEIERENITDLKQASSMVPNFYIPDYGSRITSSIYVRGIGARMDQPAVGLNIDNVGVLNKDAYDFEMSDIVSIEMLRGPQSSLFGRNTMTGLVSIRTLSPMTFQGWRLGASYSSGNTVRAHAGWYHKFNPFTAFSASAGFTHSDGRFINEYNGRKVDKEDSGSLRLRFHWQPSSSVTVTNVLSSSILRQGGYPYEYVGTGRIEYNDTCFYRRFLLTDGLTVRARIAGMELLSVTSLQHINDNMTLDQDFLPDPYFTLTQRKHETAVTEDIMLRGRQWDGRYKWLAGLYAFYRHQRMEAPVTFKEVGISRLIEYHRNKVNPYYPIRWNDDSFVLNSDFRSPNGGIAIYHQSDLDLGRWHLSAGLRFDYERVNLRYHSYCNTSYDIYDNPAGILPPDFDHLAIMHHSNVNIDEQGRMHRQYLMVLPKFTALYDLGGFGSNIYASIGRGYKAGGFNTQMFSEVLQQKLMNFMGVGSQYDVDEVVGYKPEKSMTYEIGAHLNCSRFPVSADVSLFYIDCRDQQLTVFPEGQTTGRMMTNAGRTRSFGGEVSMTCRPVQSVVLTASYGYTNARFLRFKSGLNDYRGKRLPYAPSNTLYVSGVYDMHAKWLGRNAIEWSAGCTAAGDIYWNESNTQRQPFYALLNASVAFVAPQWRLEIWGNNLTDTSYKTFYFLSMGNEFFQRGTPLTLGATFSLTL
ncbi:MAG: TonB-dependent receptor [Muribaculaceae bacterium]|nr:TonB-dependent receptor [Muribaculaceae bacterium]